MKARWFALAALLAAGACSGRALDLGSTAVDAGVDAGGGVSTSIDGEWTGYVQFYQLQDNTGDMHVMFQNTGDGGTPTATVYFGNVPTLPPPADPDKGYPPSFWAQDASSYFQYAEPVEGFTFTARALTNEGGHVRFSIATNEVWQAWCAMQKTIYAFDGGDYACCVGQVFGIDGGVDENACAPGSQDDLGKVAICRGYSGISGCKCTATACTVDTSNPGVHFDMQFEGGQFKSGSVMGLPTAAYPPTTTAIYSVYLARAP